MRTIGTLSYQGWIYPQWRPRELSYHRAALETTRALGLRRLRPELHAVPPEGAGSLQPLAAAEFKLALRPVSYLVALSGSSAQAAGFEVQIRSPAGQNLCSHRITHANLTGGSGATQGARNPLFVLPKPLAIDEPGILVVQLVNLASAANQVQLVLHVAAPEH